MRCVREGIKAQSRIHFNNNNHMKKTLITAFAAVASVATASATTHVINLEELTSTTPATSDTGKLQATLVDGMATISPTAEGSAADLYSAATSNMADISFSFTLNLSQFWKDLGTGVNNRTLVSVSFLDNNGSVGQYAEGLYLANDGDISTFWGNPPTSSHNANSRSSDHLVSTAKTFTTDAEGYPTTMDFIDSAFTSSVFTRDGQYYTVLTATISQSGVQLYDMNGTQLFNDSGLMSGSYRGIDTLSFNTTYISDVALTPERLTETADIVASAKLIPEPATATLSLLALAGLAARRRRK